MFHCPRPDLQGLGSEAGSRNENKPKQKVIMKNKISSLQSSGFLALASLLLLPVFSRAQEQPLAKKVDHIFITSDRAQSLFCFFKDTLRLPEFWPFSQTEGFSSGGLSLGNVILEFVSFAEEAGIVRKSEFQGIAFEPTMGADAVVRELAGRQITHLAKQPSKFETNGRVLAEWTNILLSDIPPANAFVFFCDYKSREAMTEGQKKMGDELVKSGGGPLGIVCASEITVGVQDLEEARSKWSALLAPSPQISGDTFVFGSGPKIRLVRSESPGIQGIILSVRSLDEVEKFLKERRLLVKDVGQIAIAPGVIEGLSIRLVEADQAREPAHPLLGPGQGTGQGIDHVGIAVRDFKKTRDDYERVLGFLVRENPPQPNGWPQSVIWFENASYLEFQPIAALPWIAGMFDYADDYADFAEKYEGAVFLGLATSSAKDAADHLKARNFQAYLAEEDPAFNYVHISHEPSGEEQAFPLAIFLIEYSFDPGRPARLATRLEQGMMTHPNTARCLHSVWFAVQDLDAGHLKLQDAGFEKGKPCKLKLLGASGREICAGKGSLLILQSVDKDGALKKFLSNHKDGDIIGISIRVADLDKARSWIEQTQEINLNHILVYTVEVS
jgi:catechol 2,3-dioxygenase-like lactoylglutathione lyase family enzyme